VETPSFKVLLALLRRWQKGYQAHEVLPQQFTKSWILCTKLTRYNFRKVGLYKGYDEKFKNPDFDQNKLLCLPWSGTCSGIMDQKCRQGRKLKFSHRIRTAANFQQRWFWVLRISISPLTFSKIVFSPKFCIFWRKFLDNFFLAAQPPPHWVHGYINTSLHHICQWYSILKNYARCIK